MRGEYAQQPALGLLSILKHLQILNCVFQDAIHQLNFTQQMQFILQIEYAHCPALDRLTILNLPLIHSIAYQAALLQQDSILQIVPTLLISDKFAQIAQE
jgi:hypothetical protein